MKTAVVAAVLALFVCPISSGISNGDDVTVTPVETLDNNGQMTSDGNWNKGQAAYSSSISVSNVADPPKTNNLQIFPEWFHVFPTYFVPNKIIQEVKVAVQNGTYDLNDPPLFSGEEEPSDGAAYFREDAQLSSMFYNWHLNFASQNVTSNIRSEMFYHFHNQLAAAYNMRANNDDWLVEWDNPIKPGYVPDLFNSSGVPFSSRPPHYPPENNEYFQKLMELKEKVEAITKTDSIYINDSYSLNLHENEDMITSILADLLYNTTDSLNPAYYKSYYDAALEYVSSLGSNPSQDAGGAVGYPMTALRDPAFYGILAKVNGIIKHYKRKMAYPEEELKDVEINSLEVDRLETYFEAFNMSVTRAVENSFKWNKFIVKSVRLNHKPFEITLNITNYSDDTKEVLVNIAIAKGEWNPTGKIDNYQPFDRFTIKLKPGQNIVIWKASDSKTFVQEPYLVGLCGIPQRLALPKGSEDGVQVAFVAAVSLYDREKDTSLQDGGGAQTNHEHSTLCGNNRFTYGKPFAFPFDRPLEVPSKLVAVFSTNVYHTKRTFSNTIAA